MLSMGFEVSKGTPPPCQKKTPHPLIGGLFDISPREFLYFPFWYTFRAFCPLVGFSSFSPPEKDSRLSPFLPAHLATGSEGSKSVPKVYLTKLKGGESKWEDLKSLTNYPKSL
jgi:hypothetical protein